MTEAIAIVWGLGIISGLFAFYAFEFRESKVNLHQNLAVGLFFMSVVFLDLVMFTIFRIAQQTPNLAFLSDGILLTGVKVAIAFTTLAGFILLLAMLYMSMKAIWDWYQKAGLRMRS